MAVEEADVEYGRRVHPLLRPVAPLVSFGAVWASREVINRSYERISGRTPPNPSDPRTSWRRAIAWTVTTATTAALIEVAVRRLANERRRLPIFVDRRTVPTDT
jgi:hypothetical protein